jgi:hypothetical protein
MRVTVLMFRLPPNGPLHPDLSLKQGTAPRCISSLSSFAKMPFTAR